MTSYAPSPYGPGSSTRIRVRWENVMIVLIGLACAAFAVVAILLGSSGTKQVAPKAGSAAGAVDLEGSVLEDVAPGDLSLDDAVSVVAEVRSLMSEGRWDEASDRLELIPDELQADSGAATAQEELDRTRDAHEQLRAQLGAAVQSRNWLTARQLLVQLAALAPLDQDLSSTLELVDSALAPAGSKGNRSNGAGRSNTAAATGGGNGARSGGQSNSSRGQGDSGSRGSSFGRGNSGGSRPSSGTGRPSATGGGSSNAAAGSGSSGDGFEAGSAAGTSYEPTGDASTGGGSGTAATNHPSASGGSNTTTTGTATATATATAAATAPIVTGTSNAALDDLGIQLTAEQEAELAAALEQAMAGF